MKQNIFRTSDSWTGLVTRLSVGLILLPHGAQKMLGLFGGYGFSGTMGYFTETLNLPWIIAFSVIFIEFIGSILILLGLGSRIWAGMVILLMLGVIFTSHLHNGFFMNWFGNQNGEGYEYHLLVIGLCIVMFLEGGGKLSIDRIINS